MNVKIYFVVRSISIEYNTFMHNKNDVSRTSKKISHWVYED